MFSPSKRYGAPFSDRVVPVRRTNPEALTANVGAAVGVGVGATVGLGVAVGAGVSVGVGVAVGAGVSVGVGVAVGAGVSVGVGVAVAAGVSVGVGVAAVVAAGVAVGVALGEGVLETENDRLASRTVLLVRMLLVPPLDAPSAPITCVPVLVSGMVKETPNVPRRLTVAEGIPAVEPSQVIWTFKPPGKSDPLTEIFVPTVAAAGKAERIGLAAIVAVGPSCWNELPTTRAIAAAIARTRRSDVPRSGIGSGSSVQRSPFQ